MSPTGPSYPGGPRRRSRGESDSDPASGVKLDRAEELEDRVVRRRMESVRRRRRKRLAVGFGIALAVAGAIGFWMGYQANQTSEEIAAEQRRATEEEFDLSRERNIILEQLWLMEDLERAPRP